MSTPPRRQPALATTPPAVRTLVLSLVAALVAGLLAAVLAATTSVDAQAARPRDHHHPRLRIAILPPVRQPGPAVAPSDAARSVVRVTLRPRTTGRPVELQRRVGLKWRTIATKRLRRGEARFPVVADRWSVYRAVAASHRQRRVLPSRRVSETWGAPDFVDEFEGATLGPAWEHRIQFYNPWGGRGCSKGSPEAVSVAGGVLRLSSMPDPAAHGLCEARDARGQSLGQFPYRLNGHVSTQQSADFLYGVAASRMRFPRSLGQHAAFWLQPRGLLQVGTTPWGAEVDIVEWYGARRNKNKLASAVHKPMPDGTKHQIGGRIADPDRYLATRADTWWDSFHVFSVEWTPTRYVFRIDGHEVWRTREGVSDVHEFLILSMLSNDFELPLVGSDPKPRTAEVDWVAFWER
jgi:Glycosyl hydrolases family 16